MEVVINGKSEAGDYSSVGEMLKQRGLDPYLVVVELNGKILQKTSYASTQLNEGDTVEIVQFVAGG